MQPVLTKKQTLQKISTLPGCICVFCICTYMFQTFKAIICIMFDKFKNKNQLLCQHIKGKKVRCTEHEFIAQ